MLVTHEQLVYSNPRPYSPTFSPPLCFSQREIPELYQLKASWKFCSVEKTNSRAKMAPQHLEERSKIFSEIGTECQGPGADDLIKKTWVVRRNEWDAVWVALETDSNESNQSFMWFLWHVPFVALIHLKDLESDQNWGLEHSLEVLKTQWTTAIYISIAKSNTQTFHNFVSLPPHALYWNPI